jgi:hypothetical protein
MPTSKTLDSKSGFLSRIPSWLASAVLSILLAFGASYLGIQRGQAVTDYRLKTAESSLEKKVDQSVYDATLKSIDQSLQDIKQDIKDLRNRTFQK